MNLTCPICDGKTTPLFKSGGLQALRRCHDCTVHFRPPVEGTHADHFTDLDMGAYSQSVQRIREVSYPSLIKNVQAYAPSGKWLDIGCSFGWLLPFIKDAGYEVYGLDPSRSATQTLDQTQYHITTGTYPHQNGGGAPYDVMTMIEVLEHLENPYEILNHIRQDLKPGGVFAFQLPDQACLLYFISLWLYRLTGQRIHLPLERLYLEGFDFPHLFYYNAKSLNTLLDNAGFEVLKQQRTRTGRIQDSWQRVSYVEGGNLLSNGITALGTAVIMGLDQAAMHGGVLRTFATPR